MESCLLGSGARGDSISSFIPPAAGTIHQGPFFRRCEGIKLKVKPIFHSSNGKEPRMETRRNMLGAYGAWVAGRLGDAPGALSFRNPLWTDLEAWKRGARGKLETLLCFPDEIQAEDVRVHDRHVH